MGGGANKPHTAGMSQFFCCAVLCVPVLGLGPRLLAGPNVRERELRNEQNKE